MRKRFRIEEYLKKHFAAKIKHKQVKNTSLLLHCVYRNLWKVQYQVFRLLKKSTATHIGFVALLQLAYFWQHCFSSYMCSIITNVNKEIYLVLKSMVRMNEWLLFGSCFIVWFFIDSNQGADPHSRRIDETPGSA